MSELTVEDPFTKGEDFCDCYYLQDDEELDISTRNLETVLKPKNLDNAFRDTNFTDTRSGSLENLVNTMDGQIAICFDNSNGNGETPAPVQVHSQEATMTRCL